MLPRCGLEARNPAIYTYPTANLYMDVRYIGQLQALIAGDSEFMLIAYKRALESQSNLQVVAILDVRMPILDGIQAAHRSGFSGRKRP